MAQQGLNNLKDLPLGVVQRSEDLGALLYFGITFWYLVYISPLQLGDSFELSITWPITNPFYHTKLPKQTSGLGHNQEETSSRRLVFVLTEDPEREWVRMGQWNMHQQAVTPQR